MLIIDAYNVLYLPMPPSLAGLDADSLCTSLTQSVYRNHKVLVVCDGRPAPHIAETDWLNPHSNSKGISLLYSGTSRSADSLIISLVEASDSPRKITVVTNDREIKREAKRRRASLLSSEAFIKRLANSISHRQPITRAPKPDLSPVPDEQVRGWLEEFGLTPQDLANDPLFQELLNLNNPHQPTTPTTPTTTSSTPNQSKPASNDDIIAKLRATEKSETKSNKKKRKRASTHPKHDHKNNRITPPLSKHVNRLDPDKLLSPDLKDDLSKYWPPPGF